MAKKLILFVTYYEHDYTDKLTVAERDALIRERHAQGETISDLAREYDISPQRVFQIVKLKPKRIID